MSKSIWSKYALNDPVAQLAALLNTFKIEKKQQTYVKNQSMMFTHDTRERYVFERLYN